MTSKQFDESPDLGYILWVRGRRWNPRYHADLLYHLGDAKLLALLAQHNILELGSALVPQDGNFEVLQVSQSQPFPDSV